MINLPPRISRGGVEYGETMATKPATRPAQPLDIFALPVHPAADEFPMLPADELQELADSIKANGLRQPLVIGTMKNGDGVEHRVLIDGRNRREACHLAGVDSAVTELNGADPLAYILDLNAHRRHLSKGQLAMTIAKIRPEPTMGRGSDDAKVARDLGVSGERLRQARVVLRYAPERVDGIKANTFKLDAAYAEAVQRKKAKEMFDGRVTYVRKHAPDLAARVEAEELTIDGAEAELRQRHEIASNLRRSTFQALQSALTGARCFAIGTGDTELLAWLDVKEFRTEFGAYFPDLKALREDAENIHEGARRVLALMDAIIDKETK